MPLGRGGGLREGGGGFGEAAAALGAAGGGLGVVVFSETQPGFPTAAVGWEQPRECVNGSGRTGSWCEGSARLQPEIAIALAVSLVCTLPLAAAFSLAFPFLALAATFSSCCRLGVFAIVAAGSYQ